MIQATIATLPERGQSLRETIDSLLPQVDALHIRRDTDGIGDMGKFTCQKGEYIFTCDDDLLYPENYVQRMIEKIEQYDRKAVISAHGKVLRRQPISSFYGGDFSKYHFALEVPQDTKVHIVGTGVLAYHSGTVRVATGDFERKNMADIWFSICCEKQGVPRIVLEHDRGWIKHSDKMDKSETCYEWNKERDKELTEAINSITWGKL